MSTENEKITPKGAAPRFEIALILIFFACFVMWSISRCDAKREEMQTEEMIENGDDLRTTEASESGLMQDAPTTADNANNVSNNTTATTPAVATPISPKPKPQRQTFGTTLYITIDGLNMRNHPHLDSAVVAQLPLFEPVTFMDEVTEFKQEINLGKEMANEPWVKVQTRKGKAGWVYGAGVHYYKIKREGVQ